MNSRRIEEEQRALGIFVIRGVSSLIIALIDAPRQARLTERLHSIERQVLSSIRRTGQLPQLGLQVLKVDRLGKKVCCTILRCLPPPLIIAVSGHHHEVDAALSAKNSVSVSGLTLAPRD